MTDLELVTDKERKVLKVIGDANMRGQQLRNSDISDICELSLEETRLIIGSLVAKGYIKGVILGPGGRA